MAAGLIGLEVLAPKLKKRPHKGQLRGRFKLHTVRRIDGGVRVPTGMTAHLAGGVCLNPSTGTRGIGCRKAKPPSGGTGRGFYSRQRVWGWGVRAAFLGKPAMLTCCADKRRRKINSCHEAFDQGAAVDGLLNCSTSNYCLRPRGLPEPLARSSHPSACASGGLTRRSPELARTAACRRRARS